MKSLLIKMFLKHAILCFLVIFLRVAYCHSDFQTSQLFEYHLCLQQREIRIKEANNRITPIPVVAADGSMAVLRCIECVNPAKPAEYYERMNRSWLYHPWSTEEPKQKRVAAGNDPHITSGFYVEKTFHTLMAFGVNNGEYSGEYFCVDELENIIVAYHLDIVASDPVKIVEADTEGDWNVIEVLEEGQIEVITEWTSWTGCNRCGDVHERRRYGKCFVIKANDSSLNDPQLSAFFQTYPVGAPCRFSMLPKVIQTQTDNRPNYIQMKLCKFECVTEPSIREITERTKSNGTRIIETVREGRYSIREPLPRLPPRVLRIIRNVVASNSLVLFCPKFLAGEHYWKKGDTSENTVMLTSLLLQTATDGRIYVDEHRNLVFDYLEGEDQGLFSCYTSDDILLMTATVNVAEPAQDALIKTGLILAGILIVGVTGVYILWSSFKMKK